MCHISNDVCMYFPLYCYFYIYICLFTLIYSHVLPTSTPSPDGCLALPQFLSSFTWGGRFKWSWKAGRPESETMIQRITANICSPHDDSCHQEILCWFSFICLPEENKKHRTFHVELRNSHWLPTFAIKSQPPSDSKCPFHPLVGGHLTPRKGQLTIPKRSLWITRHSCR